MYLCCLALAAPSRWSFGHYFSEAEARGIISEDPFAKGEKSERINICQGLSFLFLPEPIYVCMSAIKLLFTPNSKLLLFYASAGSNAIPLVQEICSLGCIKVVQNG